MAAIQWFCVTESTDMFKIINIYTKNVMERHGNSLKVILKDTWVIFPSIMQTLKQKNGSETTAKKGGKNSATSQAPFHLDESYQQK